MSFPDTCREVGRSLSIKGNVMQEESRAPLVARVECRKDLGGNRRENHSGRGMSLEYESSIFPLDEAGSQGMVFGIKTL